MAETKQSEDLNFQFSQNAVTFYPHKVIKLDVCRARVLFAEQAYVISVQFLQNERELFFHLEKEGSNQKFKSKNYSYVEFSAMAQLSEETKLKAWVDFIFFNQVLVLDFKEAYIQINLAIVSIVTFEITKVISIKLLPNLTISKDCSFLEESKEEYLLLADTLQIKSKLIDPKPLNDATSKPCIQSNLGVNNKKLTIKTSQGKWEVNQTDLPSESLDKLLNQGSDEQLEVLNLIATKKNKKFKKIFKPFFEFSEVSKYDNEQTKQEMLRVSNLYPRVFNDTKALFTNAVGLPEKFSIPNPLRVFDISGSEFMLQPFSVLLESLKPTKTLIELKFNAISLSNKGLKFLCPVIRNNVGLIEVSLESNLITDEENLQSFGNSFTNKHATRLIKLGYNSISFNGAKILGHELKKLSKITSLNLVSNPIKEKNKLGIFSFMSFETQIN